VNNTLLVVASIILLVVPVLYLVKTAQGKITPNPVTFFVRSVVSVMNLTTYFLTNGHNPWKSSVTLASTVGLLAIFFFAFYRGKFSRINRYDIVAGAIAIVVGVMWKLSKDPVLANLLLQTAMLVSFIPAIRGVLAGAAKEQVLPWALATTSYVLMTTALSLDPLTTWQQFIHPVCVGLLGNGSLALVIAFKNSHKQ
jgi:uncharacterized membrane protein